MRVLWLCNGTLAALHETLGMEGGISWIDSAYSALKDDETVVVAVCFPRRGTFDIQSGKAGRLMYYSFPASEKPRYRYNKKYDVYFTEILKAYQPDVIHIWGTEFNHSLSMVNAAELLGMSKRVVVSIQGMMSIIGRYHYFAGIPAKIAYSYTIRDLIKRDNIAAQKKKFEKCGKNEIIVIRKSSNIIGRNDWCEACAGQIHPGMHYYSCNETLRESFYSLEWDLDRCERHTIFTSQSYYPLKGFHFVLEALIEVLKRYPDTILYTTGVSPFSLPLYRLNSYSAYLKRYIKKHYLREHVKFLGDLDEAEMRDRFVKSQVFVSSSSVENESNSVSEAKMLGMPVIASYVGGVTYRLMQGKDGFFYPYDAPYMLAYYIEKVFSNDARAKEMGRAAREDARLLFDREKNKTDLLAIYADILKRLDEDTI